MFRQRKPLVDEIKTPTSVQADWEKAYQHKSSIGASAANIDRQTPCIIAVINQRLDALTWLLEAKHPEPYPWSKARTPKINHVDKDRMSALAHAVNYSSVVEKKDEKDTRWEIVTLLLKHGANITPTIDKEHPVFVAIRANNLKFINYYLKEICPRLDTTTWQRSVLFTKIIQEIFKYAAQHFHIPLLDLLTKDFSEHLHFTRVIHIHNGWSVQDAIILFSPLGICLTEKALLAALYLIENQKIKNYHLIKNLTYCRGEMYCRGDQCAIKECFTLLESNRITVDFVYRFSLALLTHVPTYFRDRDQAREALKLIFKNQKLTEEQKLNLSRLFVNQCEKLGGIDIVIEPQKMEEIHYPRFNFFEAASNFPTLVEFLSQQKWGLYTRSDALEYAINKRNFPLIKLLYEQGSWINNDTIERLNKKTIYDGETYVRLFAFVKAWDFLLHRNQFPDALDLFKQEIPKLKDEDLLAFKKAWEIHFKALPEEITKFFPSSAVVWHQPEPSAPVHGDAKLEAPPSYEASISMVSVISPGGPALFAAKTQENSEALRVSSIPIPQV